MADRYFDYGAKFYETPEQYAARIGGVNRMFRPAALGQVPVEPMPVTPTAPSQPMVTLPPDPTLSEDLRRFIPRRVQQPLDFSQFQYPEAPQYRMPGMAPTRDLGMERGATRRVSLRAALLGALLGGGTGAIAGLTGAQQGAQQAFEQDYAQQMADYQNQARLMEMENQQLASADARAIAMRNAQLQDALRAYDIQGQRMQVEDENARAEQSARLALADAKAKSDAERAARITRVIEGSFSVVPEDRAAYIRSGLTGEVPTAPLRPEQKVTGQITGSALQRIVADFNNNAYLLTPEQFAEQRKSIYDMIMLSPNPIDRALASTLLTTRPPRPTTTKGRSTEGAIASKQQANQLQRARLDAFNKWNEVKTNIQRRNSDIAAMRERRLQAGKPATDTDAGVKAERKAIESQFAVLRNQLVSLTNKKTAETAVAFVPQIAKQYDDAINEVKMQIQSFAAANSDLYDFSNLESGIPTIKPRRLGGGPSPVPRTTPTPTPKPSPKSTPKPSTPPVIQRSGWKVERVNE